MYLLIIILLGLIIGILTSFFRKKFDWENLLVSVVASMIIYGFSLMIVYIMFVGSPRSYYYEYSDQEIKSLINNNESHLNGAFFLGCGTINGGSSEYYIAYASSPKGDIRIKVDAYNTYLHLQDLFSKIQPYTLVVAAVFD
jgi:hypothetical protein